jgi:DnaK suppressor protein
MSTIPETDRSGATARLDAEQALTLGRLAALNIDFAGMVGASSVSNADDEHDPEGATIAFERSQLDALIFQAQRHLDEIAVARERLAKGTYETCENCGNPIGSARLEARPVARTCIICAELS